MTETTHFDFDRFKYHIKRHDRFPPLVQAEDQDQMDLQEQEESTFTPLPKPFTINPGDIDVGCGHRRIRRSLEKAKKMTKQGRKAPDLEENYQKKEASKKQPPRKISSKYTGNELSVETSLYY
jgi:hypothetical protein